jgi:hypothetical protein
MATNERMIDTRFNGNAQNLPECYFSSAGSQEIGSPANIKHPGRKRNQACSAIARKAARRLKTVQRTMSATQVGTCHLATRLPWHTTTRDSTTWLIRHQLPFESSSHHTRQQPPTQDATQTHQEESRTRRRRRALDIEREDCRAVESKLDECWYLLTCLHLARDCRLSNSKQTVLRIPEIWRAVRQRYLVRSTTMPVTANSYRWSKLLLALVSFPKAVRAFTGSNRLQVV